jgi:hypothetical protein
LVACGLPPRRSLVLLALLGLAALGLPWLLRTAGGARGTERTPSVPIEEPGSLAPEREPARVPLDAPTRADLSLQASEDPSGAPGPRARSAKDHLAEFTALAASPGALEARAAEVLGGDGPLAEKAALLRALRSCASPQSLTWHEHAVRAGDADLARTALTAIVRDAGRDGAARSALARLAFEPPALASELRCRAAAGFARHCDEDGLARLGIELGRQTDALLVEGVLAAVAERDPSTGRTRLLLAHGRSDAPAVPAQE